MCLFLETRWEGCFKSLWRTANALLAFLCSRDPQIAKKWQFSLQVCRKGESGQKWSKNAFSTFSCTSKNEGKTHTQPPKLPPVMECEKVAHFEKNRFALGLFFAALSGTDFAKMALPSWYCQTQVNWRGGAIVVTTHFGDAGAPPPN